MKFHPVSEIFPLMNPAEFDDLVEDIRARGQLQPIFTYKGEILDGRNRYNACVKLGIEPITVEWSGDGSLISFVVSLNLRRRHLDESQRAIAAARIANIPQGYHKQESVWSLKAAEVCKDSGEDDRQICRSVSQTDAAEMLNVSERSVRTATFVLKNAEPEVIQAVEKGEISNSAASKIAELPRAKQKKEIKKGITKLKELAREATRKAVKKAQKENTSKSPFEIAGLVQIGGVIIDPTAKLTESQFKLVLLQLLPIVPANCARYLESNLEEMEELGIVDDINDAYEKILTAISLGRNTRAEIKGYTKLADDILDAAIGYLLEHNSIYAIKQGGKHDRASGGRKTLYFRRDKTFTACSGRFVENAFA
jgi:ParB-like chromosome segregation protein Spo0J